MGDEEGGEDSRSRTARCTPSRCGTAPARGGNTGPCSGAPRCRGPSLAGRCLPGRCYLLHHRRRCPGWGRRPRPARRRGSRVRRSRGSEAGSRRIRCCRSWSAEGRDSRPGCCSRHRRAPWGGRGGTTRLQASAASLLVVWSCSIGGLVAKTAVCLYVYRVLLVHPSPLLRNSGDRARLCIASPISQPHGRHRVHESSRAADMFRVPDFAKSADLQASECRLRIRLGRH